MMRADETFVEYLTLAQAEVLTERETYLLNTRYGFTSGSPQTLETLAQEIHLSRERVRQLLQRALRKLRHRGKRDIERGHNTTACASLLLYIGYGSDLDDTQLKEKIMALAYSALPSLPLETHALPLLVGLCLPEKEAREFLGKPPLKQTANKEKDEQAESGENIITYKMLLQQQTEGENNEQTLIKSPKKGSRALESLLEEIRWPRETSSGLERFSLLAGHSLLQAQEQSEGIDERRFFSEKLKRYVRYKTLLEMSFFQALEASEEVVFYQERPFKMVEEVKGKPLTCVPDTFFLLQDGRGVLVEVMSWDLMALHAYWDKFNALRLFCFKQGWGLLITDGRKSLQQIKQHPIALPFQTALLEALANAENGSLSWNEYKVVRDTYHGTHKDFIAIVLTQRLIWSLDPFTIRSKK
jgi:DNA-binding CsgD family transcriptional regulator